MSHRSHLRLLAAAVLLSACGSGLYDFPTEPDTAEACQALVAAVPDAVAEQASTPVDSERVAAWGDPRIVLRCGVTRPAALEPTSRCDEVEGVGWFSEESDDRILFTTIGRAPAVSVEVPEHIEPAAAALIDLADVIKGQTELVDPCQ